MWLWLLTLNLEALHTKTAYFINFADMIAAELVETFSFYRL